MILDYKVYEVITTGMLFPRTVFFRKQLDAKKQIVLCDLLGADAINEQIPILTRTKISFLLSILIDNNINFCVCWIQWEFAYLSVG